MSNNTFKSSRPSIKLDRTKASDLVNYNLIYACEQCSHFESKPKKCTLGFLTKYHLKSEQLKRYNINSHLAFCRFLEID